MENRTLKEDGRGGGNERRKEKWGGLRTVTEKRTRKGGSRVDENSEAETPSTSPANVTSRDKIHTIYLPAYMCSCTSPLRDRNLCFHGVPKDQTSHRPW